ncbi:MAG TPA: hypothetical protein VHE55_01520 [Fimbriimonadaceae bacterium]|nr:hypothetical protein [Fimbriimonadaceae bacterium]
MKLFPSLLALAAASIMSPFFPDQAGADAQSSLPTVSHARKYDFFLVTKDGNMSSWGNFDAADSKQLRESKEDALYVKRDGVRYVITDPSTISQAKTAIEPMQKLGRRQGELGREQGKLGSEQGKLGERQGEYGRKIGELARKMSEEAGNGKQTDSFDKEVKAISEEMKKLGESQKALGERQKALGEKQGALGRQQAAAAHEAETVITKLIDEAFAKGLAHKQ